jgi:hypothetical protein
VIIACVLELLLRICSRSHCSSHIFLDLASVMKLINDLLIQLKSGGKKQAGQITEHFTKAVDN